jgi:hypothetical protein
MTNLSVRAERVLVSGADSHGQVPRTKSQAVRAFFDIPAEHRIPANLSNGLLARIGTAKPSNNHLPLAASLTSSFRSPYAAWALPSDF